MLKKNDIKTRRHMVVLKNQSEIGLWKVKKTGRKTRIKHLSRISILTS